MSYTTDLLLCVDYKGDKGIQPFLEAIGKAERFGDTLKPITMDGAGGTRNYTGGVYALGTNHFPTWDLQELLDSVQWSRPGTVVLVVCSEDWAETKVLRPAYEIERGGYYNSEACAVQVAPNADKLTGGAE